MKNRYCIHCGKEQEYIIGSRPDTVDIRGITIQYSELFAVCRECGEELYVSEISDTNITSIEKAYEHVTKMKVDEK